MAFRKIGLEGKDWMHLAQDMDQWLSPVNTLMNLRVSYEVGISWDSLSASEEGHCSMELVS
jgi:hypothetical protein